MNGLFETLFSGLRSRRLRRETIRQLSALSDHALKDIGLDRSEIRSVAADLTRPRGGWRVRLVHSTAPAESPGKAARHATGHTIDRRAA